MAVLAAGLLSLGCAPRALDRAQSLVRQNRPDDALAAIRERLRVHPEDIAARKLMVRVLGLMGDIGAAQGAVKELAARLPPDSPVPAIELGHALELVHQYDEALAAYDDAARVAPLLPDGPREGGLRSARWGEVEEARPRLEEAVRRGAHDEETWHALGLVRLHMGDYDGAEQAYRAGIDADPHAAEDWLGLATVGMARGDAAQTLAAYDQVVSRKPRFGPAQLGRAWALARLGRREEAAHAIDRAEALGAPASSVARQRAALGEGPPK